MWYPQDKKVLEEVLENYLVGNPNDRAVGVIVPHAGYEFSGEVAGKAYSVFKGRNLDKVVVVGPSHYIPLVGAVTTNLPELETPLGKIKTFNTSFHYTDISKEHSINNQIPFLQKLGAKEVMPLMVGEISLSEAREIAEKLAEINAVYVFSTDLSHFYEYSEAVKRDKRTIEIIEEMDFSRIEDIDACGIYPLMIAMELCKIKNRKPHLVEYKNSGDVIGDKSRVVGYAGFWF